MDNVKDRIVQYANRYKLTDTVTGEVLGTFDFDEVTGTVTAEGTPINKALFDSIQADLNTKADKDGTYTDLTAGKSNALTTAAMTASDDLNNFYGEDYWGKMFYCSGGEEPSHSPSGASGGSVFIYRNGSGSTVQEYTSNVARSGSNLPTKWIRARAYSGTWNAWEEIVTSTGDYANMSVGEATKAAQDSNGNVIKTTYATKAETNAKYTKPVSGIPKTDLAADVQTSLGKADSAYQKPSTGIPKADLAEEVQNALETAVQGAPDATTTVKGIMTLGADGGAARYGEKGDVGLGNVDNVKQYSASNPPPYPVTSVAGKTGAVTLAKSDVGLNNVDNTADTDKPVSTAQATAIAGVQENVNKIVRGETTVGNAEKLGNKAASEYALSSDIPDVSNFAEKNGTYSNMTVGKANKTQGTLTYIDSSGIIQRFDGSSNINISADKDIGMLTVSSPESTASFFSRLLPTDKSGAACFSGYFSHNESVRYYYTVRGYTELGGTLYVGSIIKVTIDLSISAESPIPFIIRFLESYETNGIFLNNIDISSEQIAIGTYPFTVI